MSGQSQVSVTQTMSVWAPRHQALNSSILGSRLLALMQRRDTELFTGRGVASTGPGLGWISPQRSSRNVANRHDWLSYAIQITRMHNHWNSHMLNVVVATIFLHPLAMSQMYYVIISESSH